MDLGKRTFVDDVGNEVYKGNGGPRTSWGIEEPWGYYSILEWGDAYRVKHIEVGPRKGFGLQLHHRRCKNWVIVRGLGEVTAGSSSREVKPFERIFIPKGTQHRIENIGEGNLVFIEVEHGD